MTIGRPSGTSRTFRDLSDKELAEFESASLLSRWGLSGGLDWDELLKSLRVLMVSEAGVGKTYECRACRDRLWAKGEPAFVLELATLADVDVRDMLDPKEQTRFDAWLNAQSETATLFLDSIDELRISQKSFSQALKRLSRAIVGQLGRARIVITTRPIPIDQQLIEKHLPIPQVTESGQSPEAFADIAMSVERPRARDEAAPKPWRNVSLMPLSTAQIKEFAIGQGVTDPDALLADIQRRDAEEYAQRPQDLIELCSDWKDHQRIRSHREQVETNATNKLKPRDRPEKAQLSVDRALEGASRLALAALLTRKLSIRYNAESDKVQSTDAALDASKILTDWTQPERDTLLERALFGFANYGRVRFHHRSVIEYLAAKRLDALLRRGVPIRAIKRLLFADTMQGHKVVRPSMRPVAAWLSIWHEAIFADVKEREPEVLLDHGDPQSLSAPQRAAVLRAYVDRYGKGGWRGLHTPRIQVHRFASSELGPIVKLMWNENIENREVRELLVEIIEAGKLTDGADIVYGIAVDADAPHRERMNALDAVVALNDKRLSEIADTIVQDKALWPEAIARSAALRLFPEHLTVAQLIKILPRVQEPKRTIGDLSWQLPRTITEGALTPDALNELRASLTSLVLDDAEWKRDKWPNTRTKRPDLIVPLIAACVRQLRTGETTQELFRSSALVLSFTNDQNSSEQIIKDLRGLLASASSEHREVAFWAADTFMQALHPDKDAWNRVFHLSHYGGIRLNPEKDRAWVLRRLGDKTNSVVEREMMLNVAMIELRQQGDDIIKTYEDLKPFVADSPPLLTIIENRLKPSPASEEMRRMEEEHSKARKRSENRDKRARASWLKFWREVADHPEIVFAEERADNTAWNLWRAMERTGNESRASGWNRRFIEEQFGREVADLLRTTLMRVWRKDKPTLRSERAPGQKNTYLVRWQLGLAAIYAESEDPLWANKLTDEEAGRAARYVSIELNGFPSWLESLVEAHPTAVDSVLGEELTLSLNEPGDDTNATISLQNVRHAATRVISLFIPRIKKWLDNSRGKQSGNGPTIEHRLSQVIDVLMQSDDQGIRSMLERVAIEELAKGLESGFAKVWLPVLLQLNPSAGVDVLENGLASIEPDQRGPGVAWFSSLFGREHRGATVDLRRPEFTPALLLRLVRLSYQHVRPSEDLHHEGSYSPDERDHAERSRDSILSSLLATKGSEGWAAKLSMAEDPLFVHFRDRAIAIARERAAEEVDGAPILEHDFVALDTYGEAAPSTRDAMFSVMRDRLDDIDDMLVQDTSHRETWAMISDERLMRREIARELHINANHVYTVDQEAATAEEKETDIRMRAATSTQQATIELKIGEKDRSAAELRKTLKDQLLVKYMAAENSRSGCLVITIASDKTWRHPDTNKVLDFHGLIAILNEEAERLSLERGGSARMMVKGYDLRPRLKTEKAAKAKTSGK